MSDREFWKGRWNRGEIGWHQAEVEPKLIQALSGVAPGRVFVPLCGKSLDLVWLRDQGHEVVGVELSALGCEQFFQERALTPTVRSEGAFQVWQADRYTIFQGDFFDLRSEHVGRITALYDRASMIALPAEVRKRYSAHLTDLVRASAATSGFVMVLLTLERIPHDEKGPPHSVRPAEVEALYREKFRIETLSEETLEEKSPTGATLREWLFKLYSSSSS